VWLDVWVVTQWHGMAKGLDGQALAWVAPVNLPQHDILEADLPIVAALMSRE
jgi:8-oxo-dGTP diphosphatase